MAFEPPRREQPQGSQPRQEHEVGLIVLLPGPRRLPVPGLLLLLVEVGGEPLVVEPGLTLRLPLHRELRVATLPLVAPHPRRE